MGIVLLSSRFINLFLESQFSQTINLYFSRILILYYVHRVSVIIEGLAIESNFCLIRPASGTLNFNNE